MSKHYAEDVGDDALYVGVVNASAAAKHRKSETADLEAMYPKFAGNIRARHDRTERLCHSMMAASAAAVFMQGSGCDWNLEWTVP